MKLDFVKNTKRNIIAALINKGISMTFPFLRKTIFMWVLGADYLGLNGLLYSILGMLMLAELGFGQAIVCYMYKPVAEDNKDLLCAYLKFYRTIYRCVGLFIFAVGLCLMPFLPNLIHGKVPVDVNLYIVYFLHLVNTAVSYFLFAYRGSILAAHHRNDITNYIQVISAVLEIATITLVLYLTRSYYYYVFVTIAFSMVHNLILLYATNRLFPDVVPRGTLPSAEVKQVLIDVKAIIMHKVGTVVSRSFDNIAISAFLGLVAVAAYNNYHSICLAVAGITGGICYAMKGGFGNKIYTESKENTFSLLMNVNRMIICCVIWCSAMLMALYQPFMVVWTRGEPSLARHILTPLLMVVLYYEKQATETLRMFKTAAALWRQDRWKAIVASGANMIMNVTFILIFPDEYKLDGVIIATILTDIIIQLPWESYVVFTKFFDGRQAQAYWRSQMLYIMLAVLVVPASWAVAYYIPLGGLWGVAVKGIASAALAFLVL